VAVEGQITATRLLFESFSMEKKEKQQVEEIISASGLKESKDN